MISNNAYIQAMPLTQIVSDKSLGIAPVPNTPLYELVRTSNVGNNVVQLNNVTEVSVSSPEFYSKQTDYEQHNAIFDETVKLLSESISTHISNAKNIVLPVVVEVADATIKNMESDIPKIETYTIIQKDLPEPMKNDSFRSSIEKAAGGVYANPERSLQHAERGPEQLLELLLTGSNEYDEKIRTWVANKGDVFLNKLWSVIFMSPSQSGTESNMMGLLEVQNDGVDYALGAFLISRKLIDEVPQDTGMTLINYTKILNQIKDAAAIRLDSEYEMNSNSIKNGNLVLSNNPMAREVIVNSGTYLKYIQNGGKNEVMLGALVSDVVPYTLASMEGRETEFQDAWDRFNLFNKTSMKNKAFSLFKRISLTAFANSLSTLTDIEQDPTFATGHVETCIAKAEEYIDENTTLEDMEDVYGFALKLVCRCRFFFTDAEKILTAIKRVTTDNPEVDVREAALVATTEYLIDYVADQMKVV